MEIADGIYTLSQDVENPRGDGRVRHKWRRQKVFKRGTKFRIATQPPDEDYIQLLLEEAAKAKPPINLSLLERKLRKNHTKRRIAPTKTSILLGAPIDSEESHRGC